jgi:malic enzyme
VGTTGRPGTFPEETIRAMAAGTERPIILALSNPTANCEAVPADLLAWTDGRALVATGSPFPDVVVGARRHEIGQANNVFIFPGVGLGAIAAESRAVTDAMFLAAAETLAAEVTPERLAAGGLYPSVASLREVAHAIAVRVARIALGAGLSPLPATTDADALVEGATWWPAYVPYRRSPLSAPPGVE